MQVIFQPEETLYHGTISIYADIIKEYGIDIIGRKKAGVDFGPGFYVTVGKKEQATEWAKHKAVYPTYCKEALDKIGMTFNDFISIKDKVIPVIMAYKIKDSAAWLELRHRIFKLDSLNWRQLVYERRKEIAPCEDYDWIFGPVADGGIYEESPKGIRAYKDYNQLSIHNRETAGMIELLEVKSC